MRCLITGVDPLGRSAVIETVSETVPSRTVDVWSIFSRYVNVPRPPGQADDRDLGVEPGWVQWVVSRWEPRSEAAGMHHTDTLDLDLVVAGSIELVLDTGRHLLQAGDGAVITGVDHAWKAGPDGCTLAVVLAGTPPPS